MCGKVIGSGGIRWVIMVWIAFGVVMGVGVVNGGVIVIEQYYCC